MSEKDPARATVTLRRHQWSEIVSGWQLYSAVVPMERQDARWRGAMPGLCDTVNRRLRQEPGDLVSIEGGSDSWEGVFLWSLCVSWPSPKSGCKTALDAIREQIAAQIRVGAEDDREAA